MDAHQGSSTRPGSRHEDRSHLGFPPVSLPSTEAPPPTPAPGPGGRGDAKAAPPPVAAAPGSLIPAQRAFRRVAQGSPQPQRGLGLAPPGARSRAGVRRPDAVASRAHRPCVRAARWLPSTTAEAVAPSGDGPRDGHSVSRPGGPPGSGGREHAVCDLAAATRRSDMPGEHPRGAPTPLTNTRAAATVGAAPAPRRGPSRVRPPRPLTPALSPEGGRGGRVCGRRGLGSAQAVGRPNAIVSQTPHNAHASGTSASERQRRGRGRKRRGAPGDMPRHQ